MIPRPRTIEPFFPPPPDTARERAFILGSMVGVLVIAIAAVIAFAAL